MYTQVDLLCRKDGVGMDDGTRKTAISFRSLQVFLVMLGIFCGLMIFSNVGYVVSGTGLLLHGSKDLVVVESAEDARYWQVKEQGESRNVPINKSAVGDQVVLQKNPRAAVVIECVASVVEIMALAAIFYWSFLIVRDTKKKRTPFTVKNAQRLDMLSSMILVMTIGFTIIRLVAYFFCYMEAGFSYTTGEMSVVLFSIVIYGMSRIFSYGAYLQEEYDTTL